MMSDVCAMLPQIQANALTELERALLPIYTESGNNLLALSRESSILLIFLRHFGCAFCRQSISDVSSIQTALKARDVRPIFVHLGTPERAKPYFDYYNLEDVERVSDPEASLYRSAPFSLGRQHPARQLIDAKVWWRWLRGTIFQHGIGSIKEDGHQMPGIFILKRGKIARSFRYKSISDQPDYLKLIS